MRVPMVPVTGKRDAFGSGTVAFAGTRPSMVIPCDYTDAVRKAYADSADDKLMAVLDVDGLAGRDMNTDLLKSKRAKGRTVMFITDVEDEDDVLDGMCGKYDVLGIPYHTAGRDTLRTALELSDTVTPVVFGRNGREVSTDKCLDTVRAELRAIGFGRICILDTENVTLDYEDSALMISSDSISMA